jgi:hypothetical protein
MKITTSDVWMSLGVLGFVASFLPNPFLQMAGICVALYAICKGHPQVSAWVRKNGI